MNLNVEFIEDIDATGNGNGATAGTADQSQDSSHHKVIIIMKQSIQLMKLHLIIILIKIMNYRRVQVHFTNHWTNH